jgi:hypothetical protein
MKIKKYYRKPLVEAMQWNGTADCGNRIIDWIVTAGGTATYRCKVLTRDGLCTGLDSDHNIAFASGAGMAFVEIGWWVYRDGNDFQSCLNTVFQDYFEESR